MQVNATRAGACRVMGLSLPPLPSPPSSLTFASSDQDTRFVLRRRRRRRGGGAAAATHGEGVAVFVCFVLCSKVRI